MGGLLRSEVWFLVILAVVVGAILIKSEDAGRAAKLAAFFTVLGDVMALLALAENGKCSGATAQSSP